MAADLRGRAARYVEGVDRPERKWKGAVIDSLAFMGGVYIGGRFHGGHQWFANLAALGTMVTCRATAQSEDRWVWAGTVANKLATWRLGAINKSLIVELTGITSYFIISVFLNRMAHNQVTSSLHLPYRQYLWGSGMMTIVHVLFATFWIGRVRTMTDAGTQTEMSIGPDEV